MDEPVSTRHLRVILFIVTFRKGFPLPLNRFRIPRLVEENLKFKGFWALSMFSFCVSSLANFGFGSQGLVAELEFNLFVLCTKF